MANAYYWHRFYAHQPDLNYDNPRVHAAMFQVLDFWLRMGVDGFRLDAVPYLYEREGTNCESLPETHAFLRKLRRHIDRHFPNRMLLAEANQWPEDAVAYFGEGQACHTAFHFPVMPRMFMALQMEDRFPIVDILAQTPAIPESCQWALFLRNHDELTLETVTDEERDYMYRVYAHDPQARINLGIRRRLAPLLGNDRRKIELMNGLLFSLPGTPILYYGDEIGMGDNVYLGDRNGVRTPMQWSNDRNAGFSRANPQRLYLPTVIDPEHHYEFVNVDAARHNPSSLLPWMKRLISLRKRYRAFGRGSHEFLYPENSKILAFIRRFEQETVLVVVNLSRLAQCVELDLGRLAGLTPVELSGSTEFPAITDRPYLLTLGPYGFYWFALEPKRVSAIPATSGEVPVPTGEAGVSVAASGAAPSMLAVPGGWESLFRKEAKSALEGVLPSYLRRQHWFAGRTRQVKSVEMLDAVPLQHRSSREAGHEEGAFFMVLLQVDYNDADAEVYVLPLAFEQRAKNVIGRFPEQVVAELSRDGRKEGVLYEPLRGHGLAEALLEAIGRRRRLKTAAGTMTFRPTRDFRSLRGGDAAEPVLVRGEQNNTTILYGNRLALKLFRRAEEGINPELEVGAFLTQKARFPNVPPLAGSIEYRGNGHHITVAVVHGAILSQGDAWQFAMDALDRYFEAAQAGGGETPETPPAGKSLLALSEGDIPPHAHHRIGTYLESARLLGMRTAEMHIALASRAEDPDFAPEPFILGYQRSLYQSLRNLNARVMQQLRRRFKSLPEEVREPARKVLESESAILKRFRQITGRKVHALRTRIHGDYHLGQVLYTGKDFVMIDFEGDPGRPISERRIKRSALRDTAAMLRSFHYVTYVALARRMAGAPHPEERERLDNWAHCWHIWVSSAFLRSYLKTAGQGAFLPRDREELDVLLDAFLLEKAVYELGYELSHRPDWVRLPLQGILQLLG